MMLRQLPAPPLPPLSDGVPCLPSSRGWLQNEHVGDQQAVAQNRARKQLSKTRLFQGRPRRCDFLQLSRVWVHLTPAASTTLPKFNPEIKVVDLRCPGGEVSATSALAFRIGLLGLLPNKIGDDIANATSDWKGLRVTVKLTIQNRQAQVEVVPAASALIVKALGEPPRARKQQKKKKKKEKKPPKTIKHSGNSTFNEIVNIAQQMRQRSFELSRTIEEIRTAQSAGCNVDGRHPPDIIDDVNSSAAECPAN
ncbi:LOW QUALITY PROTEIN: large ribosomal subunit protein uL11-like [Glossophaga mutica]